MKKIIAVLAVLAASTSALALDVTVGAGRTNGVDSNTASVAVGEKFGAVRAEASVGRTTKAGREANLLGVAATYPLTTVAGVALGAKGGVSYIAPLGAAANGYALSAGLEATYPLTKNVTAVATFEHVKAQSRVNQFDGNNVALGLRYGF